MIHLTMSVSVDSKRAIKIFGNMKTESENNGDNTVGFIPAVKLGRMYSRIRFLGFDSKV